MRFVICFIFFFATAICTLKAQMSVDSAKAPPTAERQKARMATSVILPKSTLPQAIDLKNQDYPNPKKAGLYAAILPGAGQVYNKQYWKLIVVYGAAAAAAYFINFNANQYQTYKRAYIAALEGKQHEFSNIYSTAALKQLQDGYKKYLDMSVLFTSLGYTLQIMDAIVFAHLKNFDVSKDVSLRFQPVVDPNGVGMGLVMHF